MILEELKSLDVVEWDGPLKASELAEVTFREDSMFDPNHRIPLYVSGRSEQPTDEYWCLRCSRERDKATNELVEPLLSVPFGTIKSFRTIEEYH